VNGLAEAVCDTLAQLASPESGKKGLEMIEKRPEELLGLALFLYGMAVQSQLENTGLPVPAMG
jgi:hypothetical protein